MRIRDALVCLAWAAIGCDRAPQAAAPVADQPAAVQPVAATQPATKPAKPPVLMIIDEQPREFPPARLVLEQRNSKTVALLLSDDPPQAINDDYTGNSFYLEMPFDEELETLDSRVWMFEAPSVEDVDSPSGIFLEGNRKQLKPYRIKVQFEKHADGDIVWLSGTCRQYLTSDEKEPAPLVPVTGRIMVKVP